jgi:hypothetical protein
MGLIEYDPVLGLLKQSLGVDAAPTAGSGNLITSGAVEAAIASGGGRLYTLIYK